MAPYTTYFNYLPTSLAGPARPVYNTVVGADFNRDAAEEMHKRSTKLEHYDLEVNEEFDAEEEWTGISQSDLRDGERRGMDFEDEAFIIRQSGRPRNLSFKLSEKATEAACEAAGVSREYLGIALKYVTLEMARDIGWLTHCKTVSDVARAAKRKFPLLEDMQRAFEEGSGKSMRPRSGGVSEVGSPGAEDSNEEAVVASTAPRTRSGSQPVYDPEVHAGVEMVPVVARSRGPYASDGDDEDDGDSEHSVDSQGFTRAL